jgi:hypothetical protein
MGAFLFKVAQQVFHPRDRGLDAAAVPHLAPARVLIGFGFGSGVIGFRRRNRLRAMIQPRFEPRSDVSMYPAHYERPDRGLR